MGVYTNSDDDFIKENYSNLGAKKCSKILTHSCVSIMRRASKLGIKVSKEFIRNNLINAQKNRRKYKNPEDYQVNPNQFTDPLNISAESSYIMGLIWADGSIYKKTSKISLSCKSEDVDIFQTTLLKTGNWCRHNRGIRLRSKCSISELSTTNKILFDFLSENGYSPHTKISANKILNIIPKELHQYWFRGLIDGDGCFYIDKKTKHKQFVLAGPYEQEWDFIISLFNEIGINKYQVIKRINKFGHKQCNVYISNFDGIIKLGNFIYKSFNEDHIGLNRKFDKFIAIKNMCKLDEDGNINTNCKLTNNQVREIRRLYAEEGYSYRKISRKFSINKKTAKHIIIRKIHKYLI
jgi:hypothetical protein